jgi:iron complex transport system substrate-binding protein
LEKSRVGGYFDVNYEAVLALEPDLVILLTEHEDARRRLGDLGIETAAVDHSRVEGILESIAAIAKRCGVIDRGAELRHSLENRMNNVRDKILTRHVNPRYPNTPTHPYIDQDRPRVLVAVGRSLQAGQAGEIYVSGRDGFYDDLISLAGGRNAYRDETLKFPTLSAEGLALLDPDVIVEMIPDLSTGEDPDHLLSYWKNMPGLRAVREGRVYILGGDHVVVPGPRFIDLLEEMGKIIKGEE